MEEPAAREHVVAEDDQAAVRGAQAAPLQLLDHSVSLPPDVLRGEVLGHFAAQYGDGCGREVHLDDIVRQKSAVRIVVRGVRFEVLGKVVSRDERQRAHIVSAQHVWVHVTQPLRVKGERFSPGDDVAKPRGSVHRSPYYSVGVVAKRVGERWEPPEKSYGSRGEETVRDLVAEHDASAFMNEGCPRM